MGLPEVKINFSSKALTAIKRSEQGVVALILEDTTKPVTNGITEHKNILTVNDKDWTPENYDYIEKTFLGSPSKVLIVRRGAALENSIETVLTSIKSKRFNYLAVPGATTEETGKIAIWIKSQRADESKTVKAVLANQKADNEGIINFTTTKIMVGEKEYKPEEYTARIAGILAGLPFTQSATYFELEEVTAIEENEDPGAAIDAGELILVDDGEKIKIGRAVNSLTTLGLDKSAEWQKIKIIEIFDMIKDDIRDTFNNKYIGKVPNIYDNQLLFITEVNNYFKSLADEQILDNRAENKAFVDVEALRKAWREVGSPFADLDDDQIKEKAFESVVFLAGTIKAVDATEDLQFTISA